MTDAAPSTPDGRYLVVRGRLWRKADPSIQPERCEALVRELMDARRAVAAARRAGDAEAADHAHAAVDRAKRALGERSRVVERRRARPEPPHGADDALRRLASRSGGLA